MRRGPGLWLDGSQGGARVRLLLLALASPTAPSSRIPGAVPGKGQPQAAGPQGCLARVHLCPEQVWGVGEALSMPPSKQCLIQKEASGFSGPSRNAKSWSCQAG